MSIVNYLTKTDLPNAFVSSNFDPASQQAVVNQLVSLGLYGQGPEDGRSVWVQSDSYAGEVSYPLFDSNGNPKVAGFVQVLDVENPNATVQTTPNLKVIVDDGLNASNTLTVTGSNNGVLIALGNYDTKVTLTDNGSDTVLAGRGNDSITANTHGDMLIGGLGSDTLVGGAGFGFDTIIAGAGQHSLLIGGAGNSILTDRMSGGTDTIVAGSGNDTITGVQGDQFLLPQDLSASSTMVASGYNEYNIYDGGGNSLIHLGPGHDTVNFFTTAGNDTIVNSGGGVGGADTINFSSSGAGTNSMANIDSITPGIGAHSGDFTLTFSDGQTVELDGHGVSHTQDAFVINFTDGTMHLKGGS